MMERILKFAIFWVILIPFAFIACGEDPETEELEAYENSLIPYNLTYIDAPSGVKSQERIVLADFERAFVPVINQTILSWSLRDGDLIFFRGGIVQKKFVNEILAAVPLDDGFYWNGVCLYKNNFCYQIARTETGMRIYNSGLWKLSNYCVLAHVRPAETPQSNAQNDQIISDIHKKKAFRGALN